MPRISPLLGLLTLLILGLPSLTGCSDGSDSRTSAADATDTAEVTEPVESPEPADEPEPCVQPAEDIQVFSTESGIEYVRTPDACFAALAAYSFEPNFADIDGMRMHYIDEGPPEGEIVLMLHGQPSWSYLYRKMVPVLVDAGYRVIAADHIGMGRSDKPIDPRAHVYDQQVAWNTDFIEALELNNITLFVQDWGSLIGLRIAGEMPERFARIVLANGDLPAFPPGANPFTVPVFEFDPAQPDALTFFQNRSPGRVDSFQEWINFAASATELFAADVLQFGTVGELTEAELAAYDAPFPDPLYWGAIRAFPSMLAGIEQQTAPALAALGRYDRPFLALAGQFDPNLGSEATQNRWIDLVPGSRGQDHRRYPAGHFIQDDVGEDMAAQVVEFMQSNPIPEQGFAYALRYCEILLVSLPGGVLQAEVYNTIGLNNCPQDQWDALDADAIAEEFMVIAAVKNGPRFWLMDTLASLDNEDTQPAPDEGDITRFGDIDMRLLATVMPSGASFEASAYQESTVERNTLYTFNRGRRIYELESPEGVRYIMQSMSLIIDPNLQIYQLIDLDERLNLPTGWVYRTRILQADLQLAADGLATVITDDLSNTYQRVD
ncbi:MAG: haloalkane dehalogenase [Pseudomonadota bacterium]